MVDIAIVIPVYNREELVIHALDSVMSQTLLPTEIIVVDNGSSDNSVARVQEWMRERADSGIRMELLNESRRGASSARNAGLEEVRTRFVVFLDSDDRFAPDLVECLYDEINKGDDPDLVVWRIAAMSDKGLVERATRHADLWKGQIYQSRVCTQAFGVKTDFLKRAGGWSANLPCWNDWELGIRLLRHSPRIAFVDKILTIIYPQKESITGENYYSKAGEWEKSIEAAEEDVKGLPDEKRLRGMINYRRLNLAALYKLEGHPELAAPLKQKALMHPSVNIFRRMVLNLIYCYTSRGGRGGYLIYDVMSDWR